MLSGIRHYGEAPFRAAVVHGGPGGIGSAAGLASGLALFGGFGVLEPLQSKHSVAALLDELHSQLSSHAPLVLIGHSWGAWLSAMFAARYPAMVSRLILVGCAALEDRYIDRLQTGRLDRLTPEQRERYSSILDRLPSAPPERKNELLKQFGVLSEAADSFALLPPERHASSFDGEMYAKVWAEAAGLRKSGELLEIFRAVNVPLTVIHGEDDPHTAAGVVEPLRRLNKEYFSHILPRCGHTPWKEKYARAEFFRLLLEEFNQA